ncbi:aerobic-type carbon monoxide dehydrogenase, large subunit CoxL/CutL-like protein [Burkholderia sp. Ch1-1]|uniref:xanthine dehydrogenase family protein molybdopterin-binding subunit n=1 Tax=Paraburkholderia sp. USG1 TaxID=2952268 RepID=UPI0001D230F5|nr:molybdopterin cofactor-binding domain-containing protein [Paraburkholderia sp. USG1]EIF31085.1 aerobic-type carbon monoxide dehydrogenase, large subunit CoxL/CutL-like protein [Burkholderia sp. Ch1-1]MDR8401108.1 molybdopterin-dependent oxidoreductase [Paraburkholderia sp. USG1]
MNQRDMLHAGDTATQERDTALEKRLQRHLGRPMQRLEDPAILTGRGRYGDDIGVRPGTLHAAILRSPHAHAELVSIDTDAAAKLPGVRAILTRDDLRAWSRPFVVGVKSPMEQWALAMDRVRYVGEPVAVVLAQSRAIAEDALDLLKVEYATLDPVTSIEQAASDQSPVLHEKVGSNVISDRHFRYGEPEAAFERAPHRVKLVAHYPRNSCAPIECGVVIAEYLAGDEGYDVTSNFMGPFSLHAVMAMALNVPANRLRHKAPRDSGGSFGVKQAVFPYVVLMCLASRKAGAPVKWVEDRLEHLSAATSATARVSTLEAAVESDGRITALAYDQLEDCGGYLRAPEPATFYRMHGCLTGAYAIDNLLVRNRVVLTNKTPTGLVRGFGGPQVYFALERLIQRIALELKLDVLDVYRRNFVAADAFPYRAAAGALLDSGNYQEALRRALAEGGHDELLARREAARKEGRLYGIGFAAIVEPSVSNMGYITTVMPADARRKAGPKSGAIASATVSVDLLGGVVVTIASTPAGQGHMTVCAQVVADVLGVAPQDVVVNVEFDTHKDAWSVAAGNYSSRFAGAVAGTVHLAAVRVRDKIARIVSKQLGCAPDDIRFEEGRIYAKGAEDRAQPFGRVAANAPHWAPALLPEGEEPGLRETVFWNPPNMAAPDGNDRINTSAAYGFAFDMCGIEVDRATGRVRIDRYVTAHDAGTLLNPALADGQIRGAFAQGLGAALMEEFRYGADGSFQSGTLADYLMPTTCEVPDPVIVHLETPSPFTPLGAKGLGEGNNMSTPPCIANAVADALGVDDIRLPLTPSKVMALVGMDDPAPSRPELREASAAKPAMPGGGKALTAQGSVDLPASPEAIFAVLLDPVALARVIPGCHALEAEGANQYRADVTVGVGMIKARFEAKIGLSEIDAPHRLRLAGAGMSSLGSARGSGLVELAPIDKGTRLSYDYEAQVSGKVAAVGGRMLEGAAKVVLRQLFESLGRQAAGKPVHAGGSWFSRLLARFRRQA